MELPHYNERRVFQTFDEAHLDPQSENIVHTILTASSDHEISPPNSHAPEDLAQQPPAYEPFELPDMSHHGISKPKEDLVGLPDFSLYLSVSHLQQFRKPALNILHVSQRLAKLRTETLLLRDNVTYHKKDHAFKCDHLVESSQELLDAIDNELPGSSAPFQIDSRRRRLAKDSVAFRDAIFTYAAIEDKLSKRESSMKRREETLVEAVHELVDLIESFSHLNSQEIGDYTPPEASTQPTSRAISPELPESLNDYYDKAGTVGYLRERLDLIDLEHREEALKRQLREDQDLPMIVSQEMFKAKYRVEREQAVEEIETAERALHDARQTCLKEGIDPEGHIAKIVRHEPLNEAYVEEGRSSPPLAQQAEVEPAHSAPSTSQTSLSEDQINSLDTGTDRDNRAGKPRRRKKRLATRVEQWKAWMDGADSKIYSPDELSTLLISMESFDRGNKLKKRSRSVDELRPIHIPSSVEVENPPLSS